VLVTTCDGGDGGDGAANAGQLFCWRRTSNHSRVMADFFRMSHYPLRAQSPLSGTWAALELEPGSRRKEEGSHCLDRHHSRRHQLKEEGRLHRGQAVVMVAWLEDRDPVPHIDPPSADSSSVVALHTVLASHTAHLAGAAVVAAAAAGKRKQVKLNKMEGQSSDSKKGNTDPLRSSSCIRGCLNLPVVVLHGTARRSSGWLLRRHVRVGAWR